MMSRARYPWRRSALLGLAALSQVVGCVEPAPPAAPANPPMIPAPATQPGNQLGNQLGNGPVQLPTARTVPSVAFMQTLAGTMLLKEEQPPIPLSTYSSREYRSSSLVGRGLVEAWEEPSGGDTRVVAMILDPASGSAQTIPIDSPGRRDSLPAVAGTTQGNALLVWATTSTDGSETMIVGQTLGVGAGAGPRWSYRRGAGQVLGIAVAPGKDTYLALWADKRAGSALGASSAAGSLGAGQAMLMSQRISLGGEAIGSPQLVSGALGSPSQPVLSWSGDNYLAVWQDSRNSSSRLYGRILDNAGQGVSSEILVAESPGIESPALAWDGQRFQVSWADGRAGMPGGRDYFVQAIGKTGSLDNSNVVVSGFHMAGPDSVSRIVPSGSGAIAVYSGGAVDPQDASAIAPSSIYAALLTPGATPSEPFALRGIDGVRLVDAQPWGNGMIVLSERNASGQMALDWSFYVSQANPGGFPGRPYYRDPFGRHRPLQ